MIATEAADVLSIRIVDDLSAWAELAPAWSALFDASPSATTPLQFDWLRTWWRIYKEAESSGSRADLRLVTFWEENGTLAGVLPLYEARAQGMRRLMFVSTGEDEQEEVCPDYLDLLSAPGREQACLAALEQALGREEWDCIELLDVAAQSPLLTLSFNGLGAGLGGRSVHARGACPIANLEGGFEAYLQRLSANSRQQSRRLIREGERCGAHLDIATPATADSFFDDLVRLHQERWVAQGKPGCFAAPRFTAFHRALVDQWVGDGRAILARLALENESIAVLYGFVTRSKFDFYQSGIKTAEDGPLRSPGNLAHLLLMRTLAERGIARYDFLRGSSSYKERLATDHAELFALELWRPTARANAYHAARAIAKAAWRAVPTSVRQRLRATQDEPTQ